ncbi:MAG: acyl-CoA dehydrogenase [Frankiales bacterium]|nr:acyl-CoA dehydrogenase [Frankiales bacterium]
MIDEQLKDVRGRMRELIDGEVIPAETVLRQQSLEALVEMERLKAEAKRRGLWALGHPTDIGGGGLSFMAMTHLNEIIGRSHFGQSAVGTWSMQDSIMLRTYASDAQKERWLTPLVAGEIRSTIGMTEPEVAGSDPTKMLATAVLDGDEWVVNAHKWFTTGASIAAFTTVLCRTEPDTASPHRQFSAIIVPTDTPGWELVRAVPTMGSVLGDHCEIRITDARVPYENLLGERGGGFVLSQKRLGPGRIFHCMRWLGQMQRAFDLMIERVNSREVSGGLLAQKGQVQAMIAESAADIFSHRHATLAAAERYDSGDEARVEISLVKFRGAQLLGSVIDRALQVHGALGVTSDTPLEWMLREARYARIYDGPDEVHREVVARRLTKDVSAAPWYQA